eukprot:TRINITY_DN17847_c0_g1_i1.p1 TRINITY_DN17847_c0_g1~~TRINITY_DN17847_c0_g1_i1.p1  ORF type:complete len:205 (+),score=31.12 TRINITY_DN17847_c0_g1_i1:25-615(+)
MSAAFPDAELWGSAASSKHGRPDLNWAGFIDGSSTEDFLDEFSVKKLNGQAFDEVVLLHKETNVLLGVTDSMIYLDPKPYGSNIEWKMSYYAITQGIWGRPDFDQVGAQAYNWLFCFSKRKQYHQSWEEILTWDFDTVILGHGGNISGPQIKDQIRKAQRWASEDISVPVELYLAFKYAWRVGLFRGLWNAKKPWG